MRASATSSATTPQRVGILFAAIAGGSMAGSPSVPGPGPFDEGRAVPVLLGVFGVFLASMVAGAHETHQPGSDQRLLDLRQLAAAS